MLMKYSMSSVLLIACSLNGTTSLSAEPSREELARKARDLLTTYCYRCHGKEGTNEGGFNYVLNRQRLLQRRKVVPGEPAKSRIYRRLTRADDPMPPAEEKVRPSADDIAQIKKWIEAGAPDFNATAKHTFITQTDVIRGMKKDLEQRPARQRRFTRYFNLTHLHNAGLSADELQSYRHGLSKLVNSLSWGGKVVVPQAINEARTVFRIDLRDYEWDEKTWNRILDANPYGVLVDSDEARFCATATACPLPHVRADWFVFAGSRPPLYHDVLRVPNTEKELQQLLRIDVARSIRQERAARAGFNGSGVSRNNRLIERHESNGVVYWRSYDFGSNTGKRNLFAHPLAPGEGSSTFEQDGGEFIFSLPNGLQGYMLANARGRRIDKGPTAIVSDPKRPDRAVENGLSCMGCHARGLIDKADQVRDHVTKNAGAFAAVDVELVRALYPPRERFAALIRQDAQRFQKAVEKTGAPLSATEPVVALALRFEAEMDLALTAAEVSCTPEILQRVLERSPKLAQELGTLRIEGGTIQRSVFVEEFGDLVRELKLGKHYESPRAFHDRLLQRGELLRRQGDLAGAIKALDTALEAVPASARAYHQRGLAHHDRRDLDRAIADYTEAIRLDPVDAVVHHNRGFAYYDRQDFDRALADFDQALRLDPHYAIAYNNRGLTYHRKGNFARALADFAEAIRLDPSMASAHHNRAGVHMSRGEHRQAIAEYSAAIRLDPKNATSYSNRGLARHKLGDDREAVADFTRAIERNPRLVAAYYNRGLARHALRRYDQAIADFSAAIQLDPKFARAYFQRAQAHARNGNAAQARKDRTRALELDPDLDD
jgi:tetratricopeptide (TPR) repeat protein